MFSTPTTTSVTQRTTIEAMDDLIGTAEAVQILGVDKTTITRWVAAGKLTPAMKMPRKNGAYLFKRADIEALREN